MLQAAHAGPSVVIAAITVALAAKAGADPTTVTLLAVAALAGQVSIGWSNDAFDADRDRQADRREKPIVAGLVTRRAVATAAGIALAVSTVTGFVIGVETGLASLGMVLAGWAYNMGLKASLASGVMYVIGFGLIPVVAAAAADQTPSALLAVAAAAVGLGGHFCNVLADIDADLRTGVRGLPQRIAVRWGLSAVRWIAFGLLVGASVVVIAAQDWRLSVLAMIGLAAIVALAIVGLVGRGRTPFWAAIAIAVVDVVLLLALA